MRQLVQVAWLTAGLGTAAAAGAGMATAAGAPPSAANPAIEARLGSSVSIGPSARLAPDDFGRVFRSDDAGTSWAPSHGGLPVPLRHRTRPALLAPATGAPDRVYLLLEVPRDSRRSDSMLYRSDDGGRTWAAVKQIPPGAYTSLVAAGAGPSVVRAAGPAGSVEITDRNPRLPAGGAALLASGGQEPVRATPPSPASFTDFDMGNIAVLHDDGSFVSVNDVTGRRLRLTPAAGTSYQARFLPFQAIAPAGTDLGLGDDTRVTRTMPFSFPFLGASYTDVIISDNGNVTLGTSDPLPDFFETDQQLSQGPPRIAAMWDDFDPTAGGMVLYDATASAVTITWLNLPQTFQSDSNTFQLVLTPSGEITMSWDVLGTADGMTGISPGGGAPLAFTDWTLDASFQTPANTATYEWFFLEFWTRRVAQRFYECHPDRWDQLVVWGASDYPTFVAGELAFAVADIVRNDVFGIGLSQFDNSAEYGSAGTLSLFANMGGLIDYPSDPNQDFALDANTLDIIGNIVGHRWGAYIRFDDGGGTPSDELLGRNFANWSFFLSSEASDLEGNEYAEVVPGQYRTVRSDEQFSTLDRYLMGLIPAAAVGGFNLVSSITDSGDCGLGPNSCTRFSAPRPGVDVLGSITRVSLIPDVTNVEGLRSAGSTAQQIRQAWVLIVPPGSTANPADVAKVDGFRTAWEPYFAGATDNLGSATSTLASAPTIPGLVGNNLKGIRSGDSAIFDWRAGATTPSRYLLFGTGDRTRLDDTPLGIGAEAIVAYPDVERVEDFSAVPPTPARPSPYYYEVYARDCADTAVFP